MAGIALSGCNFIINASLNRAPEQAATTTVPIAVGENFIDADNATVGFGGGTKVGVSWNTNSSNKIILGPDTDCDGNMSEGETVYTNCAELDASWTPQWGSLVSYWKMNESSWNGTANEVSDSIGVNHGVRVGDATTTSTSKIGSKSATFDGTGDYVTIGNTGLTSVHSVSLWLYLYSALSTANLYILDFGGNNNWLQLYDGNAVGALTIRAGAGATTFLDGNHKFTASSWNHITMVVGAGGASTLYVNGHVDKTAALTLGVPGALRIGDYSGGGGYSLNGRLDDVAIWSTDLTAAEVKTIYARQSAKYSGSLASRVMNYGSSNAWNGIKWLTTLPFGKELTGDANNSGTITADDSENSSDYTSLVGSSGSTSDNDLMDGIKGLWHLNESPLADVANEIEDKSGFNNHCRAKNGASASTLGLFGGAVKSDGTNDYVSCGTSANLAMSTAMTTSAWIYPMGDGAGGGFGGMIINKENDYELARFANGTIQFAIANTAPGWAWVDTGWVAPLHTWTHIVWTYDSLAGATALNVYANGTSIYSAAGNGLISDSNLDFRIGNRTVAECSFNGLIDEVAVWSRALHADEIKQLYRRGANRIKYQVRTCTVSDCSDNPTWLGNDNSNGSYFSELHNYAPYNYDVNNCAATNLILTGSPSLLFACFTAALSNLSSQQYFQYRAILESDDASTNCNYGSGATWCSPELRSVEIKP